MKQKWLKKSTEIEFLFFVEIHYYTVKLSSEDISFSSKDAPFPHEVSRAESVPVLKWFIREAREELFWYAFLSERSFEILHR